MTRRSKFIVAGAVVLAAAGAGAGLAIAGGDRETPITGDALIRARAAAIAFAGGGRVTDTEDGDEESRYEVEVTLDDGRQVDVQLDDNFKVVGSKTDREDPPDQD